MKNFKLDIPDIEVDGANVYNDRKIADIPFWYHSAVCSFLSVMGILGVSLNGFIILSFSFQRAVSEHNYITDSNIDILKKHLIF